MFGVEMEFYARASSMPAQGLCMDMRARRIMGDMIAEHLEAVSFAVKCHHPNLQLSCEDCQGFADEFVDERREFTVYINYREWELLPNEPINNCFKYFLLHSEGVRTLEPRSDWQRFEISSPIFSMTELWDGMPQIQEILSAVKSDDVTVDVNSDCGIHIHIGRAGGTHLVWAKKVASLVLLFEKSLIDKLIPNIRRRGHIARMIGTCSMFAQRSVPARGLREILNTVCPEMNDHIPWGAVSITAQDWNYNNPEHFLGTLKLIWNAPTLWHLDQGLRQANMMCSGFVVRLRSIDGDNLEANEEACEEGLPRMIDLEGSHSTLEFRYPQASLDRLFIQDWAEICCKIGELALLGTRDYEWLVEQTLVIVSSFGVEASPGVGGFSMRIALGASDSSLAF